MLCICIISNKLDFNQAIRVSHNVVMPSVIVQSVIMLFLIRIIAVMQIVIVLCDVLLLC